MSWSQPSRRSPSRSPSAPRPPVDAAPTQEPYRSDWDSFDRGSLHERDRSGFDFGRGGRSRSPGLDDMNRKRRRSPSPYERDRYDPRPRYNDFDDTHSRGYAHSPPRRGAGYAGRRAPPDPRTMDYPASLKQYAEWFRYNFPHEAAEEDSADKVAEIEAGDGSKPRNGIRSRWERYKKEFAATQLQTMFDHHRKSPWFAEKYDPSPEYQDLRSRVRKSGWKGRLTSFLQELEAGSHDPDPHEADPTSPIKDTPANGVSEANGNTSIDKTGDEEMQFNPDPDEDGADHDGARGDTNGRNFSDKRHSQERVDETSVMPEGNQVMIRTIPPDIGRVKLETVLTKIPGFVYVALGDPLQKRNYYRAGWIRFTDDADMAAVMSELSERKIEGFKLHVSHSTRPFVNRIRYAPEAASMPDRIEKDLATIKVLAALLEDQAAALRKFTVKKIAREPELREEHQPNADGDVSIPAPELDEEEEPNERGSDAVDRRVEKIMSDLREQNLVDINDERAYENRKALVALDLYIAYLRAAFHTCFYCCVVSDHLEELQRKCLKHVRKPLTPTLLAQIKASETGKEDISIREDTSKEEQKNQVNGRERNYRDARNNVDRWTEWLDSKIALLVNRDGVDPRDYGGKSYDEELAKVVEPHIKQEDEGKFRCRTCNKLFKATSFVEKHVANKHPETISGLEDLPYFNNFALDPHRIQPFAHPPSGGSNQAPPQAYGLQSSAAGFNDRFGQQFYNPANGQQWDQGYRRDEATQARRLTERIVGTVDNGLPAKPMGVDAALSSGNSRRGGGGRGGPSGPPPPPPNAREDPRAAAGRRVSYHDMDLVAEGDVELSY